ncbi:TBC1 domain family member 2B-like [Actinia tenebrosa]|uniref:TBC1 domain family member 2B-like n=1 Tax=Actinia tenebrosa TaxID=6105 RepID=A0A6P8HV50_ACTTE|nr:TBC1 domain family member 2B-like [Actinia tenebrosa]
MEDSWEVLALPPEIEHSTLSQTNGSEANNSTPEDAEKTKQNTPKLCGFLNKQGEKGLIKTWKSRWFVYDEGRCRLFYYRTPQDHVPLGFIDVANATLSFQVENPERLNQFDICVAERNYHLQAKDKQTMMFWLQQLQVKRREFSRRRTKLAVQKREDSVANMQSTGGLIEQEEKEKSSQDKPESNKPEVQVMEPVPPPETVGQEAAMKSPSGGGMFNLSLTNIRTEFRNMSAKRVSTFFSGNQSLNIPQVVTEEVHDDGKTDQATTRNNHTQEGRTELQPQNSFHSHIKTLDKDNTAETTQPNDDKTHITTNSNTEAGTLAGTLRRKFAASRSSSAPVNPKCLECERLHTMLDTSEAQLESAREEITVRQEVILNLHELLRRFQLEKEESLQSDQKKMEEELKTNTAYTRKLEEQLKQLKEEHESSLKEKDIQLCGLMEQIQMYQEMTAVKDQVVVSLTNQLHNLESMYKNREGEEVGEEIEPESPSFRERENINSIHEMGRIKEACQAYALQNRFLNSEILELNRLRQDDEERLRLQAIKVATAEAEICKYKSKYLLVLREFQRPKQGSENAGPDDEIINRLLQDAMENESLDRATLSRSVELKTLTRAGIPHQYRAQIWKQCIEVYVRETKKVAGKDYYTKILASMAGKFSPAAKQIELDLLRTLPNNKHYDKPDSDGIDKLRRVLLAYSGHNPEVGYCQGINRLVAIAMLYLTEDEAFWFLVAVIEHIMPKDYYSKTLLAAQADQRVLKDLLAEKLPRVNTHLENLSVDLSLITFNWFLTIFVDSFPIETILRIWDCYFLEGNKVLFRYALAVFKTNEEQILKIEEATGIFNYMRQVPERIADHHALTQTAFQGLNPFPMQKIKTKRNYYLGLVQSELDELDRLRADYVMQRDDDKEGEILSESELTTDD